MEMVSIGPFPSFPPMGRWIFLVFFTAIVQLPFEVLQSKAIVRSNEKGDQMCNQKRGI